MTRDNAVTLVRLEPMAPRSRVKHSTTEPLRSLVGICVDIFFWWQVLVEKENASVIEAVKKERSKPRIGEFSILQVRYCPASQEWKWRRVLFSIVK